MSNFLGSVQSRGGEQRSASQGETSPYLLKSKKAAGSVPKISPSFIAILRDTALRPFSMAQRFWT